MRVPGRIVAGFFSQSENPVRLQPVARHPQIRREVRRRLILRNRAEHVALLALQQVEQLLAGAVAFAAGAHDLVRLERRRSCSRPRRSSWIDAVQVLIVEAEGRHPHVRATAGS